MTRTEFDLLTGLYEWWQTHGRQEWFYATNLALSDFCRISPPSLIAARKRLVARGWIETTPGHARSKGNDRLATSYRMTRQLQDAVSNTPQPLNTSTLVVGRHFNYKREPLV